MTKDIGLNFECIGNLKAGCLIMQLALIADLTAALIAVAGLPPAALAAGDAFAAGLAAGLPFFAIFAGGISRGAGGTAARGGP